MLRKETKRVDLLIIGGGAAGLAAAIAAKETAPESQIALLEKNAVFGKKLRVTGNGRANLSNQAIPTSEETVAFFHRMGILTRTDEVGRIYPFSESAAELTDALVRQAEVLGCDLYLNTLTERVEKSREGFEIETKDNVFFSRKLILATGGKAGIASGERQKLRGKDGYVFAEHFGHQIKRTTPVLTGVEIENMPQELAGIRAKGEVRLELKNQPEPLFVEKGEIQFTDYGLSGICIFNLSRYLKYQGDQKLAPYRILIDLDPLREAETLLKTHLSDPRPLRKHDLWHAAFQQVSGDRSSDSLCECVSKNESTEKVTISRQKASPERGGVSASALTEGFKRHELSVLQRTPPPSNDGPPPLSGEARSQPKDTFSVVSNRPPYALTFSEFSDNSLCRNKTIAGMLGGMFKKPVRQVLLRQVDIDPSIRFSDLSGQQFEHLMQVLHGLSFQPKATKGFQMAQCTAGGVSLDELNPENGASKLFPGLYLVGELMDYDGPCGGYNLDHAFRTGALAGKDAVKRLMVNG